MMIFTLYGYIGMATFYLVSQWLAQYGQFVVGLPHASARLNCSASIPLGRWSASS